MKFTQTKTYENLARSFAGECQDHVRYKFIEYGARQQGYNYLAEVIDKIVFNEFNHARMFYTMLQKYCKNEIANINVSAGFPFKEKWDLMENFSLAAEDEHLEATQIYPEFLKTAREEGFPDIAKLYEDVIQVETCHEKQFLDLYNQMKNKTLYSKGKKVKWKCSSCGYEAEGTQAWEKCPLCLAEQGFVMLKLNDGV